MADIEGVIGSILNPIFGKEGVLREWGSITIDGILSAGVPYVAGMAGVLSPAAALNPINALVTAAFGASASAFYNFDSLPARLATAASTAYFGYHTLSYLSSGLQSSLPYVAGLAGSAASSLGSFGAYLGTIAGGLGAAPLVGVALGAGFLAYTGYHIGKGLYNLVTGQPTHGKEEAAKEATKKEAAKEATKKAAKTA